MKKAILSVLGLTLLAGCSGYDYYKTNVDYYQDGEDCVYYFTEKGKKFDNEIRNLKDDKKIVYRNTRCSDLYKSDTFSTERNDRKAIVPVFTEEEPAPKCGCSKCNKKKVLKNKYVIVPAYVD